MNVIMNGTLMFAYNKKRAVNKYSPNKIYFKLIVRYDEAIAAPLQS
jgi:hypothetical protein